MVSETGGLPVDVVFVIAAAVDHATPERMSTLRKQRLEMVHDAIPRSPARRGTSPRTWGRRD